MAQNLWTRLLKFCIGPEIFELKVQRSIFQLRMGCVSEIGLFRYFKAMLQFKLTKLGHTSNMLTIL